MGLANFNPSNDSQDFTQAFSATGFVIKGNTTTSFQSVGYAGDVGWKIPTNQLITIVSSLDGQNPDNISTIIAILDKPFSMSTSSNWKSLIGYLPDAVNQVAQLLLQGKQGALSAYSVYSTRRIWAGSEPISLNLNLRFYAVNNAYTEVLSPCVRLERMSLPTYVGDSTGTGPGFLTAPGPNPYSWNTDPTSVGGDNIDIYIGGMFLFSPVIISKVTVEYGNEYDINGYPMSATALVEFQTFQVMTKGDISKSVQGPGGPLSQPQPQTTSASAIQQAYSNPSTAPNQIVP